MNGGGGAIYTEPRGNPEDLVAQAEARTARRALDSAVNTLLRDVLRSLNDRNVDLARERLSQIEEELGIDVGLERLLLGGSVAKHTYVDGLSDIDALVVLDRGYARGKAPGAIIERVRRVLEEKLPGASVKDIRAGKLAVTVTYHDGMEVQLLPAVRVGSKLAIRGRADGKWLAIDPGAFRARLTEANGHLGGQLVPAIKLIKSMASSLPPQKQLTGYHIESICVAAAREYSGPLTLRQIVPSILRRGAELVLMSIRDITGQSRHVDSYLGPAGSTQRRVAADGLEGMARRLESASRVDDWRDALGV